MCKWLISRRKQCAADGDAEKENGGIVEWKLVRENGR
jgi:hypothetical protein